AQADLLDIDADLLKQRAPDVVALLQDGDQHMLIINVLMTQLGSQGLRALQRLARRGGERREVEFRGHTAPRLVQDEKIVKPHHASPRSDRVSASLYVCVGGLSEAGRLSRALRLGA